MQLVSLPAASPQLVVHLLSVAPVNLSTADVKTSGTSGVVVGVVVPLLLLLAFGAAAAFYVLYLKRRQAVSKQ